VFFIFSQENLETTKAVTSKLEVSVGPEVYLSLNGRQKDKGNKNPESPGP
jgi:hypothetical protein